MSRPPLITIYQRLYDRYGPQGWWPGQTPFETILGAILTQNTNWKNVEAALAALRDNNALDPNRLHTMTAEDIAPLIRPAVYFNLKAQRLKSFLNWLFDRHNGSIEALRNLPASILREHLLSIKGIGPETADSICLYAFDKPIFVVDAYTARIFGRHGYLEPPCGYQEIQDIFHAGLDKDPTLFNEYHALIVRLGKEHCKRKPVCAGCPLEGSAPSNRDGKLIDNFDEFLQHRFRPEAKSLGSRRRLIISFLRSRFFLGRSIRICRNFRFSRFFLSRLLEGRFFSALSEPVLGSRCCSFA